MNKGRFSTTVVLVLVIIAILAYASFIIWAFSQEGLSFVWNMLIMVVPLIIILVLINVYRERLRELEEQEKDPLDKY